ncbi:MAG TPA: lipid A deacylase LpxR family protein [Smithella sp.]|nr:lipid A deacylase LpxR family protein [Smithella sp.]HQG66127.1 lipid A deacylase LpxR family protein [Smithella sp.]HQH17219.1 lipid A deacylase LpxR family protein [Smithella sp.]HQI74086.1 lipid A deacylase LpxR family protein [Smithella sp.]
MFKTKQRLTLIFVFLFLWLPATSLAEDQRARDASTLTLYIENDSIGIGNTDRYYTHGTKLSWISQDLSKYRDLVTVPWMHRLIERLPYLNDPENQRTVSMSLGQNIYTPEDHQRTDVIKDDRPYAGITYLGLGLHSRNQKHMDTFELGVGLVGRHSYAEDCQTWLHQFNHSDYPRGWNNQLHDEPILNLFLERKWKTVQVRTTQGFGFDVLPHLGLALGNAYSGAELGGEVRFGWNIPNDFGTHLIRPGSDSSSPLDDTDPRFFRRFHRIGMHVFLAADGKAVARNILFDGNTFRDSHRVDKEPFVADFIGGIGLIIHQVKITYSLVYRTKEFETQRDEQCFGAIAISFTF